jgi:hypothetical protein
MIRMDWVTLLGLSPNRSRRKTPFIFLKKVLPAISGVNEPLDIKTWRLGRRWVCRVGN